MTVSWVDVETSNIGKWNANIHRCLVELRVSSADHLWFFYVSSTNNLEWRKSTDGGATWGAANTIDSTETWQEVSVWFDRWTPDDTTGNTIHIIATNTNLDTAVYFSLGVDDDTAETNNDVDIVASQGGLNNNNVPSICKATDGDIYVSWQVANTNTGTHIYRSGDSGATWGSIYGRTEWSTDANAATDRVFLAPLKTDDDILAIFGDDSGNTLYSIRYDGTSTDATGWDASNTTIDSTGFATSNPHFYDDQCFSVDDNGDVYLIFQDNNKLVTTAKIQFIKYDESASSWGSQTTIYDKINTAGDNSQEVMSLGICYDKVGGGLFAGLVLGEVSNESDLVITQSLDDGVTWGEPVKINTEGADYRHFNLPEAILHTDNKLCILSTDDDTDDVHSLSGGLTILRKTGSCVDNDGNAVTTADCHFFRVQTTSHQEAKNKYVYIGNATLDGSGNWSVVIPDHHNDTPEYQIIYDDDLANDETDASRRFT